MRAKPCLVLLGFLTVLLTFVTTACSPFAVPKPTVEKRGPVGPVPAGLERFYAQPLTWGPCRSYATTESARQQFADPFLQCARMEVPLDYAAPGGTVITLGLLRKRTADPNSRIGAMVINPGGPGESGMEAAAELAGQISGTALGKRFDLVGFDPRGVAASKPAIECLTDAEQDSERALDSDDDPTPAGVARYEAEQRDYARKCAQRTQFGDPMLANVGSRDVAKDLDVLRSALGDKQLTYAGFSYGTRIGSSYAEQFPRNVRAMVLDGAIDPDQDPTQVMVAQARGFQAAFTGFTAWCVQRPDCALGTDGSKAEQAYRALVVPLLDHPVDAGGGRKLSYDDASTATIQTLYSQKLWQTLNSGLNQLKHGDGRTLMLIADSYDGRDAGGHYSNIQDAFNAVHCVDDPRVTDRQKLLVAQQQYKQAAPFLDHGRPAAGRLDACAFWPVRNTGQPHLPQVSGLPPTLVVSTTHDPATPYQAGVNLAKALGGRLLTFDGTQHTAFLQGNNCVDAAGTNYLIELTLPAEGVRCNGS